MSAIHRGTWRVGDLPPWVMACVQIFIVYQVVIRGIDYLGAHPSGASSGLARADQSAPLGLGLTFWGLMFLTAAAAFLAGALGRWWSWVVAAHVLAGAAYFAVSWGLLVAAIENDWSGIRTPSGLICAAAIHVIVAFGTAAKARQAKIRRTGGADAIP